ARSVSFHRWHPGMEGSGSLQPRSVELFESSEVPRRIREIVTGEGIDILQLDYAQLGQYALPRIAGVKVVLVEHDIAFRSCARRRRMRSPYASDPIFGYSLMEWLRLLRYELYVTRRADQVHVMSAEDGAYLARFQPDGWSRLRVVPNGVDLQRFRVPARQRR